MIFQQMSSGEPYDARNPQLIAELRRVRALVWHYNQTAANQHDTLATMLRELLGSCGDNVEVLQPFHCDFGRNIRIGHNVYANFNLTILDEALVTIGDNVFIGPNVSIYTACHPLDADTRNLGIEWSLPVTIGDNCWIGGSSTILPGVTIGNGAIVGAGSVVTKSIPANELWVGNPAHKIDRG